MIVVNLFGAPGSGKSTIAANLFADLKRLGIRCELSGEEAKDRIHRGNEIALKNQFLMSACQYDRLVSLERCGYDVVVSDSPLMQQLVYALDAPYAKELIALVKHCDSEFDNLNYLLLRSHKYEEIGRVHNEEEANNLYTQIVNVFGGRLGGHFHGAFRSTQYDQFRDLVARGLEQIGADVNGNLSLAAAARRMGRRAVDSNHPPCGGCGFCLDCLRIERSKEIDG